MLDIKTLTDEELEKLKNEALNEIIKREKKRKEEAIIKIRKLLNELISILYANDITLEFYYNDEEDVIVLNKNTSYNIY